MFKWKDETTKQLGENMSIYLCHIRMGKTWLSMTPGQKLQEKKKRLLGTFDVIKYKMSVCKKLKSK